MFDPKGTRESTTGKTGSDPTLKENMLIGVYKPCNTDKKKGGERRGG